MAVNLGWPTLTCDDIRFAVQGITTPESHPALHNPVGHIEYFTNGPVEKLISNAVALQDALWPAIERVIRIHATVKEPIVMDWWLLSPKKVAALGMANVQSEWIDIDPDALELRERKLTEGTKDSSNPDQMFTNFMTRSLWRNSLVASEAREFGLPILHQPGNRAVESLVDEVVQLLGHPIAGS